MIRRLRTIDEDLGPIPLIELRDPNTGEPVGALEEARLSKLVEQEDASAINEPSPYWQTVGIEFNLRATADSAARRSLLMNPRAMATLQLGGEWEVELVVRDLDIVTGVLQAWLNPPPDFLAE